MLRLFGTLGLFILVSAGLALGTDSLFFRLLTLVLGLAVVGLYLWLHRSLPPRSGALCIKGLRETVDIYRDARGIPHIYACNLHDLYLAQGYVTAQDRLWAMDLNRRTASGRMAEVFGERMLELDKHFRSIGLRKAAESSYQAYSPAVREYLQAYAAGVNARIAEDRLSPEFGLLRYRPEPWTPADTLLLGKYMAYNLSASWTGDLFRGQLVQAVGAEKAAALFWETPDMEALEALEEMVLPEADRLFAVAAATVRETLGSSAWAVAGARTRSGSPILGSDLQANVRNPSRWYQSHLIGPDGLDVSGVTFPGVPGIFMGQNRAISWGAANAYTAVQDLHVERIHPANPPAAVRTEEIQVRGMAQPVQHEVMVTRHGPVIARANGTALALRWTGLEATRELEAVLLINSAATWSEFKHALESYDGPPLDFIFAGHDGTIASRLAGAVPLHTHGNQAPLPGWTAEREWNDRIPFAEMPESVNPAEGFLVGAYGWAPSYRIQRMRERLSGTTDATLSRALDLQHDRTNLHARALLPVLHHAVQEGLRQGVQVEALSETEKHALLLLSGWDCLEEAQSPAPSLWHQWYLFLMEGIFRPQLGLALFDQFLTCGNATQVTDRLVRNVAEGGDSSWLSREGEDGLNRIALRSFRRAVALVAAKQGRRTERWRWDLEHRIRFVHPLSDASSLMRWILDLGPLPVGGSGQTVWSQAFDSLHPYAVSACSLWRQVVDLGTAEGAQDVCAPGQSGHALSPHYGDQVPAWLNGEPQVRLMRHDSIRSLPRFVLMPEGTSE